VYVTLSCAVCLCFLTIVTVESDEAPSGMLARGKYDAASRFVDDDSNTHLQFDWTFEITKDWK